jgi:hypothetical protein
VTDFLDIVGHQFRRRDFESEMSRCCGPSWPFCCNCTFDGINALHPEKRTISLLGRRRYSSARKFCRLSHFNISCDAFSDEAKSKYSGLGLGRLLRFGIMVRL